MKIKREIIVFTWVDAAIHGSEQKNRTEWSKANLVHGIVAGFIVSETKTHFNIALDMFPKDDVFIFEDNFRQVASYPKSGIEKIIKRFEIK